MSFDLKIIKQMHIFYILKSTMHRLGVYGNTNHIFASQRTKQRMMGKINQQELDEKPGG